MPAPAQPLPTTLPAAALADVTSPVPHREAAAATFSRELDGFGPTTLAGLDTVSLLNRIDTKFVLSEPHLRAMLPALGRDYRVLDIDGRRLHQYRTVYFDTPGFDLYRRHHAGEAARYKVRSRTYLDSGLSYFEIKAKNERGRTNKYRVATAGLLTELTPPARALLAERARPDELELEPKLRNDFQRVTLVGKRRAERLTLDLDIQFDSDGRAAILPGVAIAELKQSDVDHASPFLHRMREAGQHPMSVSKYCIGVALLVQGVEREAFEPQLRAFERLARGETP